MVTLKDVAKELGVSAHSVSAVLNGNAKRYRISPATSERIATKARQMGYDPDDNRGARLMAARKHGVKILNDVIALCTIPSSASLHQQPYESEVLDGIESAADRFGLDVLQCRLRPTRLPRLIEKGEVDGVIMLSGWPEHFRVIQGLKLPIVKLGSSFSGAHSVSARHYDGVFAATSHLIRLGHTKIAFIGHDARLGPDESTLADAARRRLAGFRAAMENANLSTPFVDATLRESFPEYGARAFQSLWEYSRASITAVVCYNDTMAMGVISQARELGLRVPEDLSVAGFDNISQPYGFEPQIASVHFSRFQMGVRAVEILMKVRDSSADEIAEYFQEELPVEFVPGATTAVPRNDGLKKSHFEEGESHV